MSTDDLPGLALLTVLIGPLLGYLTAQQARQGRQLADAQQQLAEAQRQLDAAEDRERAVWAWARALVDQVYRLGGQPVRAPDYTDMFKPQEKDK